MRTYRGAHLVPRSGCSARKVAKPSGSKPAPARDLERHHHLVAGAAVGHRVHGHAVDRLVALQDPLDRCGGEVLAVDPEPVAGPAGEVEDAVLVPVPEVAGPVPAVAGALGLGLGVVVVALEPVAEVAADQLADRLAGVQQPAVLVEARPRALHPRLGVDHRDVVAVGGDAERTGGAPWRRAG